MPLTSITRTIQTFLQLVPVVVILFSALPAAAQSTPPTSTYTFADCRGLDKESLRNEIEENALRVLSDRSAPLDIDAVVARKWAEMNVDAVINAEVAMAVATVQTNESYWSRLWSGWSADKAEEFATTIANNAFGAQTFKDKLDQLSTAIGSEIARKVQSEFAAAASAAFLCLQEYVGDRYSTTLFSAFQEGIQAETAQIAITTTTNVEISPIDVHGKALTGVGIVVVSEITRRVTLKLTEKIAERVASKIIGRVLGKAGSSLIPIAGWVIGLGLIVWDLWEGGKGALPQIQEALQSEEVKEKIRAEISMAIKDGLPQETAIAAVEISVSLIDEWESYCRRNQYVCIVADENPEFRSLLNFVPLSDLGKLSNLIEVFIASVGRQQLDAAIDNGDLERMVALPAEAATLLASNHSVESTLAWAELAGDRLTQVVNYSIHERKAPTDFDRVNLGLLLDLENADSISKLTKLDTTQLRVLLSLPTPSLREIAANLTVEELQGVADYFGQPQATPVATLAVQFANGDLTLDQLRRLDFTDSLTRTSETSPTNPAVFAASPAASSVLTRATIAIMTILALLALVIAFLISRRTS